MSHLGSLVYIPLYTLVLTGVVVFFRAYKSEAKPGKPHWTPWEAVSITVAAYFLTQLVGWAAIAAFVALRHGSVEGLSNKLANSVGVQFFYVLIVDGLIAWTVYKFIRRRQTPFRLVGWVRPKLSDMGYTLIGFGLYFAAYTIVLSIVHKLIPGLNINQKQELGFDATSGGLALILAFLSLVVLPPLVEEFLMRGFLFSGLRTKLSFLPAAIITSVLFASAHLQAGSGNALLWVAAIDTFTLSLVLVTLREKTGSLWPGIGLHALKNMLAFMAIFVFHLAQ